MDAQKRGHEMDGVLECEDGTQIGGVADVCGGINKRAAGESKGVFEFAADR